VIPYTEKQSPNSKFVNSKVAKKVGLKTRASTNGRIKTASPAKISKRIKLYFENLFCLMYYLF
jgi:hypothetical protein